MLHESQDADETLQLQQGEAFVGFVRLRKMTQHTLENERLRGCDHAEQFIRLIPPDAIPVHSGIDLQMDGYTLAGARRQLPELAHGEGMADAASQIMRNAPWQFGFLPV